MALDDHLCDQPVTMRPARGYRVWTAWSGAMSRWAFVGASIGSMGLSTSPRWRWIARHDSAPRVGRASPRRRSARRRSPSQISVADRGTGSMWAG